MGRKIRPPQRFISNLKVINHTHVGHPFAGGHLNEMNQLTPTNHKDPPQLSVRHDSSAGSATGHDTLAVGEPQQPQEGNDIYLSCSLEANPRPIKPILWRFNGRPIQALPQVAGLGQPAPMIVMSNQSLVLRKVNRNQSGSYTCEAQNQHGTNTSRPLEVDIRHAPVCVSEDV